MTIFWDKTLHHNTSCNTGPFLHLKSKYPRISFVGATHPCLRKETKLSILSYKSSSLDSADGGGIAEKDQNKRKESSVLWGGGHLCDDRAYFLKFTMFLLSAGSLAIRGLFNNIKKYEENER